MSRVLITGMSGTGKSTVVSELMRRGFDAIDLETDEWSKWTMAPRAEDRLEIEQYVREVEPLRRRRATAIWHIHTDRVERGRPFDCSRPWHE
jgi:adenylate kinase family enzyme